jgi:hypothetical protein
MVQHTPVISYRIRLQIYAILFFCIGVSYRKEENSAHVGTSTVVSTVEHHPLEELLPA